jgi:hypothetical protein
VLFSSLSLSQVKPFLMGSVRTREQFWSYSGIDFATKKVRGGLFERCGAVVVFQRGKRGREEENEKEREDVFCVCVQTRNVVFSCFFDFICLFCFQVNEPFCSVSDPSSARYHHHNAKLVLPPLSSYNFDTVPLTPLKYKTTAAPLADYIVDVAKNVRMLSVECALFSNTSLFLFRSPRCPKLS